MHIEDQYTNARVRQNLAQSQVISEVIRLMFRRHVCSVSQ